MRTLLPLLMVVCSAGCYPDVGECDSDAAHEIVYDNAGVPAYAGQAIMIESCGSGRFCHASEVEKPADRLGAPAGLSFDVRIATQTIELEEDASNRLRDVRTFVQNNAGLIWQQVSSGNMPPGGAVWEEYASPRHPPPSYDRFDDDGLNPHPLPRLRALPGDPENPAEAAQAREILRNWLACGAPVIERTQERFDHHDPAVGDQVPVCERNCVYPSWESIYQQILFPSCARSRCHARSDPAEGLNFDTDLPLTRDPTTLHAARAAMDRILDGVMTHEVGGSACVLDGETTIVAPGDPASSLLSLKVHASNDDAVCGSAMPLAGNHLTDQRLCAISEWIRCRACAANDEACLTDAETCLGPTDTPRCRAAGDWEDVDVTNGVAECAEQVLCPNRPPDNPMM